MEPGIRKLLVANRGEIACRIFRACRDLGIETVAVYSEADVTALHVREADEAYNVGDAPASESYLNIPNVVAAIHDCGADAVHPGYGFMSESAAFARAVQEAGAVWIGPGPEAMEQVGNKVRAKEISARAGVPIIPGYDGADQSEKKILEEAERIGYPVLVKASAGGGGRGMREVYEPKELAEAVRSARREAEAAFSDGTIFLEKLIERPRHIEVQIVGDRHGNVVHLYERDCSIQRRHQKIVEEAPSPALSPKQREEVSSAAVRLAREVGYESAGTVEFLLSGEGEFYFLEMNARLQVEHPVTEAVTGRDIVKLQLAVALGGELPAQRDITLDGAAIEARIYAEDENGYPSGGRLLAFDPPTGPGVRNDCGVQTGDEVSLFYDAMISKLIVHAPDREAAVLRLAAATREYTVIGSETNLPLLRRIAASDAFASGQTTTDFLQSQKLSGEEIFDAKEAEPEILALAAAAEVVILKNSGDPFEACEWRQLGLHEFLYPSGGGYEKVELEKTPLGVMANVLGEDEVYEIEALATAGGRAYLLLDGIPAKAEIYDGFVRVHFDGECIDVRRLPPPDVDAGIAGEAGGGAEMIAPMPGTIVRVAVAVGETVRAGQMLLVLEAMKMEQSVVAPHEGIVTRIPFGEGDLVSGGDLLAEVEIEAENE